MISNRKAALIIPWNEFKSLCMSWFGRPLSEIMVALKIVTGYRYDNKSTRVVGPHGGEFAFNLRRNIEMTHNSPLAKKVREKYGPTANLQDYAEITVWNYDGGTQVYSGDFIASWDEHIPDNRLKEIKETLIRYARGIIGCADCERGVDRNEAAFRRYFAGLYCQDCWDGNTGHYKGKGGWKEKEARETYD